MIVIQNLLDNRWMYVPQIWMVMVILMFSQQITTVIIIYIKMMGIQTQTSNKLFLGKGEVTHAKLHHRQIGSSGSFSVQALKPIHESPHVMRASLANPGYDFEYYITGVIDGQEVIYPVTGEKEPTSINQTFIIMPL